MQYTKTVMEYDCSQFGTLSKILQPIENEGTPLKNYGNVPVGWIASLLCEFRAMHRLFFPSQFCCPGACIIKLIRAVIYRFS